MLALLCLVGFLCTFRFVNARSKRLRTIGCSSVVFLLCAVGVAVWWLIGTMIQYANRTRPFEPLLKSYLAANIASNAPAGASIRGKAILIERNVYEQKLINKFQGTGFEWHKTDSSIISQLTWKLPTERIPTTSNEVEAVVFLDCDLIEVSHYGWGKDGPLAVKWACTATVVDLIGKRVSAKQSFIGGAPPSTVPRRTVGHVCGNRPNDEVISWLANLPLSL
jgi:hypothetical protein